MNRFKALLFFVLLFFPLVGFAQTLPTSNELTFSRFHADLTVLPSGELDIVETITGEFLVERRGIFRFITRQYEVEEGVMAYLPFEFIGANDESGEVMAEDYIESPNAVVRLGDPEITRIGPFEYKIHYRMKGVFFYGEEKDELFWQVSGVEWPDYFEQVSATLRFPEGAEMIDYNCITGYFQEVGLVCNVFEDDGAIHFTTQGAMTLVAGFTGGLIAETEAELVDSRLNEAEEQSMQNYVNDLQLGKMATMRRMIYVLLAGLLFLIVWRVYLTREKMRGGTIITAFAAPRGLRPLEVAYLLRGRLQNRDYVALLVDLAVRGYLRIDATEDGFTVTKGTKSEDDLAYYECVLYKGLFYDDKQQSLKEDAVGKAMAHFGRDIALRVQEKLVADKYFEGVPGNAFKKEAKIARVASIAIIAIYALASWRFMHVAPLIGAVIAAFLAQAILIGGRRYTIEGTKVVNEIQGFKQFIYSAERFRVKWQEDEHLFESVLPYAMIFGLAEKWQKVYVDDIVPTGTNPDFSWLKSGKATTASAAALTRSLQKLENQIVARTKEEQKKNRERGSSSNGSSSKSRLSNSSKPPSMPRSSGGGKSGGFGGGGGGAW